MSKKNKVKQCIAGFLSVATVLGSVSQPSAAYSANEETGNASSVIVTEKDAANTGMASVSQNSVSGNGEIGGSVSGGDAILGDQLTGMLTVSGSDAQYELDEYFTAETYVAIRNKSTSQVAKMRSGDDVTMDLAWEIDADAMGLEGVAAFTYSLPDGVSWEKSEGNLGNGTYRLEDGALSIFYDMAQVNEPINAHLYVGGRASTYALAEPSGNIRFPDGSAYLSYDESERLASIAAEWASKGLLPYENWIYGDSACNNNIPFDRHIMSYYSDDEANEMDARMGEAAEDTYFLYTDDIQAIIQMAEDGMNLDKFFYGNLLYGLTLNDLYQLADEGCTLTDVVDTILSEMPDSLALYSERLGNSMYVSGMNTYTKALGVVPQLGTKNHGAMWKITTSQGQVARCLQYGGSLKRGDTFHEVNYFDIADVNGVPISLSKYHCCSSD